MPQALKSDASSHLMQQVNHNHIQTPICNKQRPSQSLIRSCRTTIRPNVLDKLFFQNYNKMTNLITLSVCCMYPFACVTHSMRTPKRWPVGQAMPHAHTHSLTHRYTHELWWRTMPMGRCHRAPFECIFNVSENVTVITDPVSNVRAQHSGDTVSFRASPTI